ncbi:MAG: hypothetical protein AAF486_08720 [Pseudomonadota bacterium]
MTVQRVSLSELDIPPMALSVRQPSAWAIIHGGKVIENRTLGAIKSGQMDCRPIAIHAATGLTRDEYAWSVMKMQAIGVTPPRPEALASGAIIGWVNVVDIVDESDSPWFGRHWGLVLEDPQPIAPPIPAIGRLGYFEWAPGGKLSDALPWMRDFDRPNGDDKTGSLFAPRDFAFKVEPKKPSMTRKR